MSKIICEVCGTAYPETASQCPICGCVRPADVNTIETETAAQSSYTYVKGGRFSKANVRKRNRGTAKPVNETPVSEPVEEKESGSKGLVITAIVLMLAIIAVVAYVVVRFFFPLDYFTGDNQKPGIEQQVISCTDLALDVSTVTFNNSGDAKMIYATPTPADTTDTVSFTSEDTSVAKVNQQGKVVAVGPGTTTITVQCGNVSASLTVTCEFADPTDDTTEATSGETTEPTTDETTEATTGETTEKVEFMLNRKDITFTAQDETWELYSGSIPLSSITWSSEDESIAKVENGKVIAVGKGTTNVYAEYEGTKVSCIIRCNFAGNINNDIVGSGGGIGEDNGDTDTDTGNAGEDVGDVTEDGGYALYSAWGTTASDVTISVGESFTLSLKDASGNSVEATWSTSDSAVCTAEGNTFTGAASGTTSVTATYGGNTYTCTVRVG